MSPLLISKKNPREIMLENEISPKGTKLTQTHSGNGNINFAQGDINESHVHYGSDVLQSQIPKEVVDALTELRDSANDAAKPSVKAEALRMAKELMEVANAPQVVNKSDLKAKADGWNAALTAMGAGVELIEKLKLAYSAVAVLFGGAMAV
jgi:hypothetical protein